MSDEKKTEAVATKPKAPFLALLESRKQELASVCVKALNPKRLYKLAQQAFSRVPKLAECEPGSIYMAVLHCAETGLEPGPLQHAAIVPYLNNKTGKYEAQFQAMFRGLLHLARNSQAVKSVHCDVVHKEDTFSYWTDENGRHLKHQPSLSDNPGPVTHAYMVAEISGNKPQIEVMTKKQLDTIKSRAKSQSGPWVTDTDEMYRKTVFKRGSKWLPLSTELQVAIAIDNEEERGADAAAGEWTAPTATAKMAAEGIIPLAVPDAEVVDPEGDNDEGDDAPEPGSFDPDEDAAREKEMYLGLDEQSRMQIWVGRFSEVGDVKQLQAVQEKVEALEPTGGTVRRQAVALYNSAKARLGKKK